MSPLNLPACSIGCAEATAATIPRGRVGYPGGITAEVLSDGYRRPDCATPTPDVEPASPLSEESCLGAAGDAIVSEVVAERDQARATADERAGLLADAVTRAEAAEEERDRLACKLKQLSANSFRGEMAAVAERDVAVETKEAAMNHLARRDADVERERHRAKSAEDDLAAARERIAELEAEFLGSPPPGLGHCPECDAVTREETRSEPLAPWGGAGSYSFPVVVCSRCGFEFTDCRKEDAQNAALVPLFQARIAELEAVHEVDEEYVGNQRATIADLKAQLAQARERVAELEVQIDRLATSTVPDEDNFPVWWRAMVDALGESQRNSGDRLDAMGAEELLEHGLVRVEVVSGVPLAQAREGGVPECVERWRGATKDSRARVVDYLRNVHGDMQPFHAAADCLAYLATKPPPAAEPAVVVARDGDVEALRDRRETNAMRVNWTPEPHETALSRARIYPAAVVDELVGAAAAMANGTCLTDGQVLERGRLRKALAAMAEEGAACPDCGSREPDDSVVSDQRYIRHRPGCVQLEAMAEEGKGEK
jgi:DNA-directed RNA polymerase subunit RPC12/RpoP